jgi:hypothetical protein
MRTSNNSTIYGIFNHYLLEKNYGNELDNSGDGTPLCACFDYISDPEKSKGQKKVHRFFKQGLQKSS